MAPPRKRPTCLVLALGAGLTAVTALPAQAAANVISPESPHSPGAEEITTLYWIGLIAAIVLIVAVNGGLIYAVRRFRSERGAEPRQVRSGPQIQRRVAAGLGALALLLFALGVVFTQNAREAPATGPDGLKLANGAADPLVISATGQQWLWRYDYPNAAFSYYKLVVPVDTTIELRVLSTDVVHSWYVPELGGKVDGVPGKVHTVYFRADDEGTYSGASAQLSGQGYAAMRTEVEAVSADQYRSYVERLRSDLEAAQESVVRQVEGGTAP